MLLVSTFQQNLLYNKITLYTLPRCTIVVTMTNPESAIDNAIDAFSGKRSTRPGLHNEIINFD